MLTSTTSLSLHANNLILFAHIIEAGSFTQASELTGLTKSTLSRRISELEDALGERLMQRTTRRLILTEFGEQILSHARRLRDEAEAAAGLALHRQVKPHGVLRVSMPPDFQDFSMVEVLREFIQAYPEVRLELDLSARRVDLLAERIDVAIRAARSLPDDSTLVARPLITLHNALYASTEYLEKHGRPRRPAELLDHAGLALVTATGQREPWQLSSETGEWSGLPARVQSSNSMRLLRALAVEGMGIVGLSDQFARDRLEGGRLERILPDWQLPPVTIWCVTPGRHLLPQRTIVFISVLRSVLTRQPD